MSYSEPVSQPNPEPSGEFVSARARRRRAQRRAYFPADEAGRAELFTHLARRAFPTYEIFVFALVSGAILGLGYFLDSQALLIFGILVAPLMTPWVGMSLAIIGGAGRFFLQTITALLVSALIIFLSGALAGFASRAIPPRALNEAFVHSRLWWPDIFTITVAAIILTISFVRSEERPYLPSALLTYGLFLPLCAAGFGLGSGVSEVWPQGLFVFLVHFTWATFFAILSLFFLRFYPTSVGGLSFTGLVFVILIAVVLSLTGFGKWAMEKAGLATPVHATAMMTLPSPTQLLTFTPTPKAADATEAISVPSSTPSRTQNAGTQTFQSTLPATETSTATVTAEPTPIIALIRASEGGGAFIRQEPGGTVIATLGNGATVTIIPDDLQEINKVIWVHVFALVNDRRVEGWMIQSVLQTATPVANWQPSATPVITQTP
jgi:Predicted membrane protein